MTWKEEIKPIAESWAAQAREALLNKPIERVGRRNGAQYTFASKAVATGRLANSVQVEETANGYQVTALHYVHFIEYGRRPGTFPPVQAIADWMAVKGFSGSTYPVARSMAMYGSTIWQRFKGENSGIFDEVDITPIEREIIENLAKKTANLITVS